MFVNVIMVCVPAFLLVLYKANAMRIPPAAASPPVTMLAIAAEDEIAGGAEVGLDPLPSVGTKLVMVVGVGPLLVVGIKLVRVVGRGVTDVTFEDGVIVVLGPTLEVEVLV